MSMSYHVYVTASGDGRIARFSMDRDTAALDRRKDVPLPGRPAPIALHPDQGFMHVARRDANLITSFRIDKASGDLSEIGTVPTVADPCHMSVDRSGRFLLAAYYLSKKVTVRRIGDDGAVIDPPVVFLETGIGAHCFQTDPSNRFAFVPHIAREDAPNAIFQFRFDAKTGQIAPNDPPLVHQPPGTGPRHYCFHPTKDIVSFSNEQGCSVSAYALDTAKGTLSLLQTISTLPEGWTGQSKCSQIRMTPDGRFLYAPNRGHDSIAGFAVDPANGLLTALGQTPAEKIPRAFEIDPAGRYLLSAGHDTGRLAVYRIDSDTGRLTQTALYDVGAVPMWVTIIPAE
jgi:6-phosphogluconolactonase